MLKGIDVSHHNKYEIFPRNGKRPSIDFSKHDFVIIKATEGRTYVDPMLERYIALLGEDQLYGFYHFARPENNSPRDEAMNFCGAIRNWDENAMLVLDWEGKAVNCPITWAVEWCKYVEEKCGKKPLIYCSSWYTKKCLPLLEEDIGLWVAHYTKSNKPTVYTYPTWAMWQYTSEPYDKDVFNGNKTQFRKYCTRKK